MILTACSGSSQVEPDIRILREKCIPTIISYPTINYPNTSISWYVDSNGYVKGLKDDSFKSILVHQNGLKIEVKALKILIDADNRKESNASY